MMTDKQQPSMAEIRANIEYGCPDEDELITLAYELLARLEAVESKWRNRHERKIIEFRLIHKEELEAAENRLGLAKKFALSLWADENEWFEADWKKALDHPRRK